MLTLLNAACTSTLPSLKPYKMDIQQGNVVTYKMVQQLRPGMTKSQVRFVMGTPILQDTFHGNRWDYFYQFKRDGKVQDQRRVILEFKDDQLVAVKGDTVGEDVVDPASKTKSDLIAPRSKQTLTERLQFWKADDTVKKSASPDAPSAQVNASAPAKPEKSWTDKLKFWSSDEKPASSTSEVKVNAVAAPDPGNKTSEKSKPVSSLAVQSEMAQEDSTKSPPSVLAVPEAKAAATEASPSAPSKSMLAVSPLEAVTATSEVAPASTTSTVADSSAQATSSVISTSAAGGNAEHPSAVLAAPVATESQPLRPYTQSAEPANEVPLPLDDSPIEMTLMAERFIATPSSRMKPKEFTPVVGLPVRLQLDRQLRPEFLPNPATDAATEGPADAAPGYFERLLEKIGF